MAVHEFDVEHGILARINHPQIIRLIGAGRTPRRFIVLEHLHGGTLTNVLGKSPRSRFLLILMLWAWICVYVMGVWMVHANGSVEYTEGRWNWNR